MSAYGTRPRKSNKTVDVCLGNKAQIIKQDNSCRPMEPDQARPINGIRSNVCLRNKAQIIKQDGWCLRTEPGPDNRPGQLCLPMEQGQENLTGHLMSAFATRSTPLTKRGAGQLTGQLMSTYRARPGQSNRTVDVCLRTQAQITEHDI